MKKRTALFTMMSVCVCFLSGCVSTQAQSTETKEPVELTVFAAASLTETLEQIGKAYEEQNPGIKIVCNFDSSGTLKTQIEEGADCDLFLSAAPKQMNQLDITADPKANPDGLDFIDPDTRINLLENKVTLAVPDGNPKNLQSFDDMAAGLKDQSILLAMGNEDVPVDSILRKYWPSTGWMRSL